MELFLVTRTHGRGWREGRPLEEQDGWRAHADFINALEARGWVVLGGPVEGTADALLVVWAEGVGEIRRVLADDPWTATEQLTTSAVRPWEIRIGAPPPEPTATFLRHTLATLVYRGAKAVRGAPPEFASFRVGPQSRTPALVLAHIGDVLEWGAWLVRGEHRWRDSEPLPWAEEVERFFRAADELDGALASTRPAPGTLERVFQGPIADVLTHIGQLAMLRRLAGSPVRGENYARAEIVVGRTGAEQAAARVEFE